MHLNLGLVAIIITLLIIVGAVVTRRCVEFMIAGSMVAAIFLYGKGFLTGWSQSLQDMLAENVWVMLVCLLFGGLISLLTDSKGSFGFSKYISKVCNTERKTLLTTFIMGILIFVDDYLNVLSIGTCMKKISDKQKLPRETLAYLLDSTGAPVCVLLPFSTWAVFYASLFYEQDSVKALGATSAMGAYLKAIPFLFYPIITLVIVFLFVMGWMPKIGPMKKAYQRVEETGMVYSESSRKYNHENPELDDDGNIWNFLIPMGVLVAVAVVSGDILSAVILALIVCFAIYVPRKILTVDAFLNSMIRGFGDMLPTLTMLLVTFVLKDLSGKMGMTEYIILHYHTNRISTWSSSWSKPGSDHGCRYFRRNIRKPCMLLFRCNSACSTVCRSRQYGTCLDTDSLCDHCQCIVHSLFRCGWICAIIVAEMLESKVFEYSFE